MCNRGWRKLAKFVRIAIEENSLLYGLRQCTWLGCIRADTKKKKLTNYYKPQTMLTNKPTEWQEQVKKIKAIIQSLEQTHTLAEQVYAIKQNISGDFEWESNPQRVLVHEGELVRQDNETFYGFLFSDLLLLTKAISCGFGRFQAAHYKSVPLQGCLLERVDDCLVRLSFLTATGDDYLVLKLPSATWLHHLATAIQNTWSQDEEYGELLPALDSNTAN